MLGRVLSAVGSAVLSLLAAAVKLACAAFIAFVVLANIPRLLAADTALVRAQVAAGVLLYTTIAYWAGFRAL